MVIVSASSPRPPSCSRTSSSSCPLPDRVAETSLERDRGVKLALYAAGGIPVVWVPDLPGDLLWVGSGPRGSEYAAVEELGRSASVRRLALPGVADDLVLTVGDVLRPPK